MFATCIRLYVRAIACIYIYLTTLPTLPLDFFCYNFKTTQDIETQIAGTTETCFKGKMMPANFYKEMLRAFGYTNPHF